MKHQRIFNALILFVLVITTFMTPKPASANLSRVWVVAPGGSESGPCDGWYEDWFVGKKYCELYAVFMMPNGQGPVAGDEIWVKRGTYDPVGLIAWRDWKFNLPAGVKLMGGFTGNLNDTDERVIDPANTILTGEIGDTNNGNDNSYNVIYTENSAPNTLIEGFTIKSAHNDNGAQWGKGGGLYAKNSSVLIKDVIFEGNYASYGGGGLFLDGGSPQFSNVTFRNNTAGIHGGGMYLYQGNGVTIATATFSGNQASTGDGGGLNSAEGSITLKNVAFSGNTAGVNGGGLMNWHNTANLANVAFYGNRAPNSNGGGWVSDAATQKAQNILFSSNAALTGGGLYTLNGSLDIANATFAGNAATSTGGMRSDNTQTTVRNSIFWDNTGGMSGELSYVTQAPTIKYCDIQGSGGSGAGWNPPTGTDGGGNIDEDPRFIDPDGGDNTPGTIDDYLRLKLDTPAADAGNTADILDDFANLDNNPATAQTPYDLDYSARIKGLRVDIGAYELTYPTPPAAGQILFVDGAGAGMRSGVDWADALGNLHFALAWSAAHPGKIKVWVKEGVYRPSNRTDRNTTFTLNPGVEVYGGFAGTETSLQERVLGAHPTILSGAINSLAQEDNSYRVVTASDLGSAAAILDGFTISGAYNDRIEDSGLGGGIYIQGGGPTIRNVIFRDNTAASGGGMANAACASYKPQVIQTVFYNNTATANGGAVYNATCSPVLTNVTISNNTAASGGGLYNTTNAAPILQNSIVWGNTGGQIVDLASQAMGANCMVEGGYTGCTITDTAAPFVNASGADPDLHLVGISNAIDAGSVALLKTTLSVTTLDGVKDLGGSSRCFADKDLKDDPDPCEEGSLDLGAYETVACSDWPIHFGGDKLAEGQKYRLGYHADVNPTTTQATLAGYAAERKNQNLSTALSAYQTALGCASGGPQADWARAGIENTTWELSTGAVLEGNDWMTQALDLTAADPDETDTTNMEKALRLYNEAVTVYDALLNSELYDAFLADQPQRVDPIANQVNPYLDVQRLAMAMARRSRASLELGESHFRSSVWDDAAVKSYLEAAYAQAESDLERLYSLWPGTDPATNPGITADVNYQDLVRSISDIKRLLQYIAEGKNALGYKPEWIPIYYDPNTPAVTNYEQANNRAASEIVEAQAILEDATEYSQQVTDDYVEMQERYGSINTAYGSELTQLCGSVGGKPDLAGCKGGTIGVQIASVNQAQLRLQGVIQQMDTLYKRIDLLVYERAKIAGINDYTAELIDPETSTRYQDLSGQSNTVDQGWKTFKGVSDVLSGMVSGGISGGAFGPWGAVGGGLFGGLGPAINMISGISEEKPKSEVLYEFQIYQNLQLQLCEGQIEDVKLETQIKDMFLGFGELEIEYRIALENLHQELLRLQGMTSRVEYLLAEQARAQKFTELLYQDPGHRVLRDFYMELAQNAYDDALEIVFQSGRALEYEANQSTQELNLRFPGVSTLNTDDVLGIRNLASLDQAGRGEYWSAFDQWRSDNYPQVYVTENPPVTLSRQLGFMDPVPPATGPTAEEQFNAFVRDPANRCDLVPNDGNPYDSLCFNFSTSIAAGNPFFSTSLYNDRIVSVAMRVRGQNLGRDSVQVQLRWGASCESGTANSDCAVTLMRSQDAFSTLDENGNCMDDLHAYKYKSKQATIVAGTGKPGEALSQNTSLATRSVDNATWALTIKVQKDSENSGLVLDNIDEVELIITHKANEIQTPACQYSGSPQGVPPYQPMQQVIDPQSLSTAAAARRASAIQPNPIVDATAAAALSGTYYGMVAPAAPAHMPMFDLNLAFSDQGGVLSGFVIADKSPHFPLVGQTPGPALTGSVTASGFELHTDPNQPYTVTLSSGKTIARTLQLTNIVIDPANPDGSKYIGNYRETYTDTSLTSAPMVLEGTFEMWRFVMPVSANFAAAQISGRAPLTVIFRDMSTFGTESWLWDFGDGTTSTAQSPTHTYTKPGWYTVTLTVTKGSETDTLTRTRYIFVGEKIYLPSLGR